MGYFFKVLWGNLLLQKGPQDFSYSHNLMRRSLMIYFITGLLGLMINISFEQAVLAMLVDVLVLVLFVYLCLQAFSKTERFVQSVISLASIGTVFQVAVLPLLYSVNVDAEVDIPATQEMLGLSVLLLLFVSWNLAVYAHIFKASFDVRLSAALLLTICYIVITMLARKLLFSGLT